MKKTYRKLMLRGIKSSAARYLSILAIVAIGVGFLGGLSLATTPDMQLSMDTYYDNSNTFDISLKGNLGLTDDDIRALDKLTYTDKVEPRYSTDIIMDTGEMNLVTRVIGIPNLYDEDNTYIDKIDLLEGRMPIKKGECLVYAIGSYGGDSANTEIGTKIALSHENVDYEDLGDTFAISEFTIVGIALNPSYISFETEPSTVGNGSLDMIMFVDADAYSLEVYTDAFVTINGAKDLGSFSEEYTELIDNSANDLEFMGIKQSEIRTDEIKDEANAELADAREEFEAEKADAEKKLKEAEDEINDAKKELEDGKKEIADGEKEIADARVEIADNEAELNDGENELINAQETLNSSIATERQNLYNNLDSLVDEQYYPLLAQINQAKADGEAQIAGGREQINAAYAEIDAQEAVLLVGEEELKAGREEYNNAVAALEPQLNQYDSLDAQYNQGVTDLDNQIAYLRADLESRKGSLTPEEYEAEEQGIDATESAGRAQLTATREQLDGFKAQLDDAKAQLAATDSFLSEKESEIATGKAAIEAGRNELALNETNLNEQESILYATIAEKTQELNNSVPTIRQAILDEGTRQIDAAQASAQAEIDSNWITINDGRAKIADARVELVEAEAEIADAKLELADGEKELADGEAEYLEKKAEADVEIADAQKKIDDAQKEIDDLENAKWYIFTREDNVSYVSYKGNAEKVAAIATVFPVFFFLVAALVALTTMTRMVEEERTQIGTLKALGYKKTKILFYYMGYSISASLIGSIGGIVLGFYTLPVVISSAYSMMYVLPPTITAFYWDYAVAIILIAVACTTVATLSACLSQLKERPASLMLPKAPKAGKRIFLEKIEPLWKRLSFTQKVAARNIFRYKKRLFMTVFGIAGCCALLVAGFGVRDSIGDIAGKQFGQIYNYNLSINLRNEFGKDEGLVKTLDNKEYIESYTPGHSENMTIDKKTVTVMVPEIAEELPQQINLRNRISGETLEFSDNAAILTEKLCEQLSLKVGDTFIVDNGEGESFEFTLTGIAENYLSPYLFITANTFESAFGEKPTYKSILARLTSSELELRDKVSEEILESSDIAYISFTDSIMDSFNNSVKNIDYIVLVLIISAGGLAIIVLYNLTNINICERKRELATTKVLGFHGKEVAAYIYRETTVLCILGIVFGLVLGVFLHGFVISTAEVDAVMFGREIYPLSYVYAAAITLLFTALVDVIMLKKINDIDMVESMKANE